MATRHAVWVRGVLAVLASAAAARAARADVVVRTNDDHSVAVTTGTYAAAFDAAGDLTGITVKGLKTVSHHFVPAAGVPSVNVIGKMVAVRSGAARAEWTFGEGGVHILTEGYEFNLQFDPAPVRTAVVPNGRSEPMERPAGASRDFWVPNSTALTFADGSALQFTTPLHVHGSGRLVPTCYCNGSVKPGQPVEFDLKLGGAASGAELLNGFALEGVGADDGPLNRDGSRSAGIVHFAGGAAIAVAGRVVNVGPADLDAEYRLTVVDHYEPWHGKEVFAARRGVAFKAASESHERFDLPPLPSGFYFATLELWHKGAKVYDTKLTFAVDLPHYAHPLTRPDDFTAFWQARDRELRGVPMNAQATLLSDPANPNKAYDITIDMPRGRKLSALLRVGADVKPGTRAPATLSSQTAAPVAAERAAATKPAFACARVTLEVVLPGDAAYIAWERADDNNLLDCILAYVRCVDYLAARPEVLPQQIHVTGASRSGPLAFIAAARRPRNVAAASLHVPTSAGISWTDKPYYSWGMPPGYTGSPEELARFVKVAAYVDPVNHAPDVIAPVVIGYGIDDGLSRPAGIEAMFHLAASPWKRIARNGGGHQYSPEFQQLEKDLAARVAGGGPAATQESILKEH